MFLPRKAKPEADSEALQLVGLEEIKWNRLQHAYGAATDVPKLLRDLASRDVERGEKALYQFYGNIWHQGTTYQATAYAVPFLRQILRDEKNLHRAEILRLLAHLAFGHSYHDVHQSMIFYEAERRTAEFQATIQRELSDVERAYEAVRAGLGDYLELCEQPAHKVRLQAIYLSSLFGNRSDEVAPLLWRLLGSEQNRMIRATSWLGLQFCAPLSEKWPLIRETFLQCDDQLEKWALAALLLRQGDETDRENAAPAMIAALDASEESQENFSELPWCNDDISTDSIAQLQVLGSEARRYYRPFCEKLHTVQNQFQASNLVDNIAPLFFGDHSEQNPVKWAELDEPQREIMRGLAETDAVWGDGKTIFLNLTSTLRYFGLPAERAQLQALIPTS